MVQVSHQELSDRNLKSVSALALPNFESNLVGSAG
jgi:hypothetical protein